MKFRLPYLTALTLLAACTGAYSPVRFTTDGDRIIATGSINHTTLSAFEEVIAENPGIKTLVLQNIGGLGR